MKRLSEEEKTMYYIAGVILLTVAITELLSYVTTS